MGITRYQGRHDRGVDHPQILSTIDSAFWVDHSLSIASHATGSYRVITGMGMVPGIGSIVCISCYISQGPYTFTYRCCERLCFNQALSQVFADFTADLSRI